MKFLKLVSSEDFLILYIKSPVKKFLKYAKSHPKRKPQKKLYESPIKAPWKLTVYPIKYWPSRRIFAPTLSPPFSSRIIVAIQIRTPQTVPTETANAVLSILAKVLIISSSAFVKVRAALSGTRG